VLNRDGEPAERVSGTPGELAAARAGTITHGILAAHNEGGRLEPGDALRLRFDALASHDITFVGIIQTAKVSGLRSFPVPYVLTNCHNSLCAVGGTINEDDHVFGLSAARKYGGVYVPPHLAVIHSYMREAWAGCGKMILGSDSHTRYGALGTLGVGEGGGELVKQLLSQRYDMAYPRVIAVYLEGKPRPWTGPMDVALAIIGPVFKEGFAKNAVLEFTGPGVGALPVDYRNGIDVMTTETACWSSVWETDELTREYLEIHRRAGDYRKLQPREGAFYDGLIRVDLGKIRPMIAMPFHPSNVYLLDEVIANPGDVFRQVEKDAKAALSLPGLGLLDKIDHRDRVRADQGIIAGCAGGTFDNITAAADILAAGGTDGAGQAAGSAGAFSLSVYPGSQSIYLETAKNGTLAKLAAAGAVVKTAFCGPCFGAGDVPANRGLSIRHTTRNFPNREGSRPNQGQIASVALMDARSIAATAFNGGILSSAGSEALLGRGFPPEERPRPYHFDDAPYRARVYDGAGRPDTAVELRYGPNITDWPGMEALGENLLLKIVSFITDPVTTTDELIPSGETSSYRSNPRALAEFTLSRKDPAYVGRAKGLRDAAAALLAADLKTGPALSADAAGLTNAASPGAAAEAVSARGELSGALRLIAGNTGTMPEALQVASAIFAVRPGDGSAREQAASCQRVLGGGANFAGEYATKRYRSNLINWGIIPFIVEKTPPFRNGDYLYIPGIRTLINGERASAEALIIRPGEAGKTAASAQAGVSTTVAAAARADVSMTAAGTFTLAAPELNDTERELLLAGSLINYNRDKYRRLSGGPDGE
jgi:aconitate hydratase